MKKNPTLPGVYNKDIYNKEHFLLDLKMRKKRKRAESFDYKNNT